MGIGLTLQELEGWRGQYDRVVRWHGRVVAAANADPSPDELDCLFAFFESCFHLREWLLVTAAVDQKALKDLDLRDLVDGLGSLQVK